MPKATRYFNKERTEFQEIDHIVISPSGIFHIDSKCYSGKLEFQGGYDYAHIGKNNEVIKERDNIIWQTERHKAILQSIVGNSDCIHNVICVPNGLDIIGLDKVPTSIYIVPLNKYEKENRLGIKDFIRTFKSNIIISNEEREEIKNSLFFSVKR
jgi:hypothetical protein